MKIRNYRNSEYPMIAGWWKAVEDVAPTPGMLPENSTWIVELKDGQPILCVSLYYTNSEICYIENFIGNPECPGYDRRTATRVLLEHLEQEARAEDYERLVCLAPNAGLERYYKKIGFQVGLRGITSMVKPLSKEIKPI